MRTLKTLVLAAAVAAGGMIGTGTAHAQNSFRELAKQGDVKKAAALADEGHVHKAFGEYADALEKYKAALEIDPNCTAAHAGSAWVHNEQKEYGKAKAAASAAIKIDDKCAAAYRERGFAVWMSGQKKAAKADFITAVECDGTDLLGYTYLIAVLDNLGEKKQSAEYAKLRDAEADRQANPEQKKTIY